MIIKKRKFIVILVLIALTICAIFVHSALSPEVSEKESEAVSGIVDQVLEVVVPNNQSLRDFVSKNIRKIAHFVEFGALGLEACIFFLLCYIEKIKAPVELENDESFVKNINYVDALKYVSYFITFGILVAFLDESFQILSKRGPSVLDMWIDILGYMTFAFTFLMVIFVIKLIRIAVRQSNIDTKEKNNDI